MPVYLSLLIFSPAGGDCYIAIPPLDPFMGAAACHAEGMLTPQWQKQHLGWEIRRVRCSIGARPPYDT
jgi:hypothetical protein